MEAFERQLAKVLAMEKGWYDEYTPAISLTEQQIDSLRQIDTYLQKLCLWTGYLVPRVDGSVQMDWFVGGDYFWVEFSEENEGLFCLAADVNGEFILIENIDVIEVCIRMEQFLSDIAARLNFHSK
jgi:hypothetical protein